MLRITVEIVPGGAEFLARELARAELGNVSSLADTSDYFIRAREGDNPLAEAVAWESRGMILNHDRKQTVWALVLRAATYAAGEAKRVGRKGDGDGSP